MLIEEGLQPILAARNDADPLDAAQKKGIAADRMA
jgi:hypothetical protein